MKIILTLFLLAVPLTRTLPTRSLPRFFTVFFQTAEKTESKQEEKIEEKPEEQEDVKEKRIFNRKYKEEYKLAYVFEQMIYKYMLEFTKTPGNKEERMIMSGKYPDYFPDSQKKAAQERQAEKKKENILPINLRYSFEPFRYCVFPVHQPNGYDICINQESLLKAEDKKVLVVQCKQIMCINCCNYFLWEMKQVIDGSIVSFVFHLNDDQGFNKVRAIQKSTNIVERCRTACLKEYPFVMPEPPLQIVRLNVLGVKKEFPAHSCADLKAHGREDLMSGTYFVDPKGGKEPIKQFCDMTTDEGGWTPFFVYRHHPYEKVPIQEKTDLMPFDQWRDKFHFDLNALGYHPLEIKELRFFCMTNHKTKAGEEHFVHFKTANREVIQTAFDQNQENMDPKAFMSDEGQLPPPDKLQEYPNEMKIKQGTKYFRAPISKKASIVGTNKEGGLWDTPFSNVDSRWTVKGPKDNVIVYECGDIIQDQIRNGADYDTLHQVWFRANPLPQARLEARQRKIIALLKQLGQEVEGAESEEKGCE